MRLGIAEGMLIGMKTTITVDSTVRDRLSVLARHHQRALGDELAALLGDAEARLFWERVSDGYAREGRFDPGGDATSEFPEYVELAARGPLPTPEDLADDIGKYPADRTTA